MKYGATFLVLFATWILLAGIQVEELIIGGITSIVLAVLIAKNVDYKVNIYLPINLVLFLVIYIPVFVYKLVIANLDIARRVLSVKIPLNPGFVRVDTKLSGDYAKLTLANSITLTPGTLTVDVSENNLYVHWVDVKGDKTEDYKNNISSLFEKILGVIFK